MTTSKKNIKTLEDSLTHIQSIVDQIEDGQVDLEKNMALYEDAIRISKEVVTSLNKIEKKFHVIQKESERLLNDVQ